MSSAPASPPRPAVSLDSLTVARTIDNVVRADASDGFALVPHITPGGVRGERVTP
ncbi:hypothetical protein GCM10010129_40280 [Streptomyces fumigatiscleroticus]|nr:hypothetical protein GCM10010129_40280 [Streptomyces fumigatiscleroticus]